MYTISWCICKLPKYTPVCVYHHGAVHVVVYIDIVVYLGSLHIHQEMAYTTHFLILSRPKPGGGVYMYGVPKTLNLYLEDFEQS